MNLSFRSLSRFLALGLLAVVDGSDGPDQPEATARREGAGEGSSPPWQCCGCKTSAREACRRTQVEAIGEVFNLFNSENPDGFVTRRYTGTIASPSPNPTFMQPTTFAGDFRQPEQRVGQLGLRFTF